MLESEIVSVERIMEYTEIEPEAALTVKEADPVEEWPDSGEVTISNLKMKYRPELNFILKGISCHIRAKEKIGIVGRFYFYL